MISASWAHSVAALVILAAAGTACAAQAGRISEYELSVNDRVTLAGVLDPAAYDAIEAADATVVELRTAPEGIEAEARALIARGVYYVHLPVGGKPFTRTDVQYLQQIVDARPDKPVILHCASGNRAAAIWGALRLEQGAALEDVLREVGPIATKEPTRQAIRKYASSR